ncbi:unnamed protein product [Mytilus edulis]|uniref:Uncharacterized protein n=1 Tax=Mytilus edulis TaxID=6550 RepID=A0A8S3T7Q0_MYTED|nr:unnamed protein product [Mytilus edulis]
MARPSVNATSSSNSTSASGGPPSSAKKRRRITPDKPQNKPNNSGKAQKTGGMRPVIDLSILNKFLIVPHFKMETNRSIRASLSFQECGLLLWIFQTVFPHSHFQNLQEIPSYIRLEQQSFPVQGSPFWPVYSPFGFYQNHAGSYSSPTFPVYSDSFLSGRFPSQGILPNQIEGSDRLGHQLFSVPRLPYLLEKVRDNSVSRLCFPGEHFLTSVGLVLPPEEKFTKLCQKIHLFLTVQSVTARQFLQLLGLLNSLADVIPLGRLHIRPLQFYLYKLWIAASQEWEALIPITQPLFPHLQWWLVRKM